MNLVDIEYHKPCSHYDDGYHRKRSGWYTCECGASSVWHEAVPVEPDRKTIQIVADALEIYEGQDFSEPAARWSAAVDVLAALGIGDNDERQPVDVPGLPPVEKCPYCDQCRPMGLRGCLGHYPSGAGIGDKHE